MFSLNKHCQWCHSSEKFYRCILNKELIIFSCMIKNRIENTGKHCGLMEIMLSGLGDIRPMFLFEINLPRILLTNALSSMCSNCQQGLLSDGVDTTIT